MTTNSIHVAHVANSIERLSGGEVNDYDATADFAAELLTGYLAVVTAVVSFMDDKVTPDELDAVVKTAVDLAGV